MEIHVHIHNDEVKEGNAPKSSSRSTPSPVVKKKRKVSKYAKEFGKQLKALKKKHPRTATKNLMKRAHSATKKRLK